MEIQTELICNVALIISVTLITKKFFKYKYYIKHTYKKGNNNYSIK